MILRWFDPLIWAVFLGCVADVWTTISNMMTYEIWGERNLLVTPDNFIFIAGLRMATPLLIVLLDVVASRAEIEAKALGEVWDFRKPVLILVFVGALFFTWTPVLVNLGVVNPEIASLVCVYCR